MFGADTAPAPARPLPAGTSAPARRYGQRPGHERRQRRHNYTVSSAAAAGTITPAPLTVTAQTDNRVYNGTTSSAVAPVVTGTTYDVVGTAATQIYDNKNVGTAKTLTASGLVMNDGNSGNNYAVSYVANNTGSITPAHWRSTR